MTRKKQVRTVIFDTVKKQKGLSLGIVSAVIGAVVFALIPPLILADIVDSITAGTDAAFARILLYFAMLALTGFTESARESLLVVFGQKITHALRSSLMDKFTHLTADNMTKQEPGTLVSRFVGDVDTVETLFSSGIISMFADACRIISILVVIRFQNRGLAIVLLVLLPFLFCFTRHVQKNMLAAQIENRKAVGRASGYVPETLHNIRTIHCLGKEKYMEKRYDTYINESYRAMEKTNFYDAVYSPVILITNAVVVAVVLLLSASGTITASRESVPFVEFRDVTFGYDKRVVLDHLSFKVMDGDQVTLTGRTGAGKSTIFKLLLGLYKPQSGEVLIHGVPAADIRDDERRRLFGCVEQTFHMVPGTVRDQITLYDSTISDEAVHTAAELTGLKDTIESMEKGYDTRCTDDLFSQGQWQLLSTANLDAETERAVLSALKRVAENRTVISISHRTSAELGCIIALTD